MTGKVLNDKEVPPAVHTGDENSSTMEVSGTDKIKSEKVGTKLEGKNDKEVPADEIDEASLNITFVLNDIIMNETLTGSGTEDFGKDQQNLEGNDEKENNKDKREDIGGNQGGKEDEDNNKTKENGK